MFLSDGDTTRLVSLITKDPSDEDIKSVIKTTQKALPDEMSVAAEIELIAKRCRPGSSGYQREAS